MLLLNTHQPVLAPSLGSMQYFLRPDESKLAWHPKIYLGGKTALPPSSFWWLIIDLFVASWYDCGCLWELRLFIGGVTLSSFWMPLPPDNDCNQWLFIIAIFTRVVKFGASQVRIKINIHLNLLVSLLIHLFKILWILLFVLCYLRQRALWKKINMCLVFFCCCFI